MKKIGYILGRRIRGDVRLDRDPITNRAGRLLLGEALTGTEQDYDEASDVQNYSLGSKLMLPRGRSFHYARVAAIPDWVGGAPGVAFIRTQMGAKNSLYQAIEGLPAPSGAVVTAAAAGVSVLTITVGANDGPASDGVIPVNHLQGGHIVVFPAGGGGAGIPRGVTREILSNTVTVANVLTVTLDRPVPCIIAAGSRCACMASEYAAVQSNDEWMTCWGMPMLNATALQYIWLQTWGPIWQSAQLTVGALNALYPNNQAVVFRADGSLGLHGLDAVGAIDVTTHYAQHAGMVMTHLNPYDGFHPAMQRGAPFVYLQITP